jgi:hypothetical protein
MLSTGVEGLGFRVQEAAAACDGEVSEAFCIDIISLLLYFSSDAAGQGGLNREGSMSIGGTHRAAPLRQRRCRQHPISCPRPSMLPPCCPSLHPLPLPRREKGHVSGLFESKACASAPRFRCRLRDREKSNGPMNRQYAHHAPDMVDDHDADFIHRCTLNFIALLTSERAAAASITQGNTPSL